MDERAAGLENDDARVVYPRRRSSPPTRPPLSCLNNGTVTALVTHLLGGDWISRDAPAVAEAVRQFEDGQDELALGGAAFLQARL